MENVNESVRLVLEQVQSIPSLWKRVNKDLSKISLHKSKHGNWGIFYNDVFQGLFLDKSLVIEEEIKEYGWKIGEKMEA